MGIFGKKKEDDVQKGQSSKDAVKVVEKKTTPKSTKKEQSTLSSVAAYDINIMPVITEKTHALAAEGKYTFRVKKSSTKTQVKNAVESMHKVTVEGVHIIVVKPKRRTVKYDRGYQNLYKKAIVTLKKGDHIAVFEGA
jgi:large subunit ribosomal protein L23